MSNFITGDCHTTAIHVEIPTQINDGYDVSMSNGRVSYRSTRTELETALDDVIKMAFNCQMARIIYGDQKGFMRWVESIKEIFNT